MVLLTPEQAAEAPGIGRWKPCDLLRQGRLGSIRIGSCRRISTVAPAEYVRLHAVPIISRTTATWPGS